MKKLVIAFLILFSAFSLYAENYEVATVIGKVSYEKDGKKVNGYKFVADEVQFMGGKKN